MAGARDDDLGPRMPGFIGINNLSKETSNTPNTLREGVDVDMDKEGKITSRRGYGAVIVECGNGHSLWADKLFPVALFADGADLRAFHPNETAETLLSTLSPGLPVSYARINNDAYWSNGIQRGMVTLGMETADWACEQPDGQPALSTTANGRFKAGQVQVCVTFIDRFGRESGASVAATIELSAEGGVLLENIPQPTDPAETPLVAIYATGADGTALYAAARIPAGLLQYSLLSPPDGRVIATQHLRPMPAGHIVAYGNGRQFVARDNFLFWSEPLRYGLLNPAGNYMRFPQRIDMAAFSADGTDGAGLYVAAGDRTYWLGGADPAGWRQNVASVYGAIPGTACPTPAEVWGIDSKTEVTAWLSKNGHFCVGLPGGKIVSHKEGEAVTGVAERGASLFREADGLRQFLSTLRATTMPKMGVGDKAIARVYRHDGAVS